MAITIFWTQFLLISFLLFFTIILTKPTYVKKIVSEENVDDQENKNNDFPPVNIQTKNGHLRGFRIKLEPPPLLLQHTRFRLADIFLGIPFAQPPIERLRLEKPLPPKNWNGTFDATTIPPACVPQHVLAAPYYSEDCLYLNLFRPTIENKKRTTILNTSEQNKLPILIFIHGGGFCIGGTFFEGYNNITNNFVSQGIIVITIQYRLNFLGIFLFNLFKLFFGNSLKGFFSDGTTKNSGNLGLWDQRQALLWIRQNVATFGGDPNRVTVWGQSAGAASTSILSISPYTRDLFQQSIQQSGSLFAPWALNEGVLESSKKTSLSVGCSFNGAEQECLKQIDLEDLIEGIQKLVEFLFLNKIDFGRLQGSTRVLILVEFESTFYEILIVK
uniref:Carboxylic ester hydrolase n=1 Tax=Meloidogyne hapla TaxID=6305 RepID=A0A1I8BE33_MELHA